MSSAQHTRQLDSGAAPESRCDSSGALRAFASTLSPPPVTAILAGIVTAAMTLIALTPVASLRAQVTRQGSATVADVALLVALDRAGNAQGTGSGFFVGPGELITNLHVVRGAYELLVLIDDEILFASGALAIGNRELDLIQLRVHRRVPARWGARSYEDCRALAAERLRGFRMLPTCNIESVRRPYLRLATELPSVGDRIKVAGYPYGFDLGPEQTVTFGAVTSIRAGGQILQIDAAIAPGNSGGPVLNEAGEVIGVATSQFVPGADAHRAQLINFAVSASSISELRRIPAGNRALHQLFGIDQVGVEDIRVHAADLERVRGEFTESGCRDIIGRALARIERGEIPGRDALLLRCLQRYGEHDEWIPVLETWVEDTPDEPGLYRRLGEAYRELRLLADAIAVYEALLAIKPFDPDAHFELGRLYVATGRSELAALHHSTLLAVDPPKAEELRRLVRDAGN